MGCESSSPIADEKSVSLSVTWRPLLSSSEAKNKYINEGTLPKVCSSGQLEFRGLLDDAIALVYLRKAAAENNIEEFLACWLEIYSFKFPKPNVLFSGPYQIYQRYLHADKVVGKSSLISKEKSQEIASYFDKDAKQIPVNVFDFLVLPLFEMLYEQVFIDFKSTVPYYNMAELLRKKYNSGKPHDFTYYEVLGEGGFGIVVHVVKKSTGKHYAMKIQTKEGLFKSVSCVPWRTDFEKQALVSCRHPFIIELHYAFQSKTMVMLVTTLGSYKTLGAVLKEVPNRQLDRERVVFYGAEITCALMYLHTMGLIYRDLKPGNVLLLQDGHIQLIDLGSVIDVQGLTLGVEKESDGMAPIFAAIARRESESSGLRTPPGDGTAMPNVEGVSIAQLDGELSLSSAENSSNVARLTRARSIVGTFGYMVRHCEYVFKHVTGQYAACYQ